LRLSVKPGELIWQRRMPGGICIYLGEVTRETTMHDPPYWTDRDEPVYLVLHPEEGIIEDPSYYYELLATSCKHAGVMV